MIPGSEEIETIVLQKITPTPEEKKQIQEVITHLKKEVMTQIKKTNIKIEIELVGSITKDTFIRQAVDIDLFLKNGRFHFQDLSIQPIGPRV